MSTMANDNETLAWKKLLDMSTSISQTSKGRNSPTEASDVQPVPVSHENLEFLQKVMALSFAGDPDQGPSVIQKFFHYGGEDPEKVAMNPALLAAAKELAEQLDSYLIMGNFSEYFVAEGGLRALANLTLSPDENLRLLYLRLVPQMAENRPEFQQAVSTSEVFDSYLKLLKKHKELRPSTLSSLLSAISAIVRSYAPAFFKFVEKGGLQIAEDVIRNTESHRNAAKVAHILDSFNFTLSGEIAVEDLKELRNTIIKVYILLRTRHQDSGEGFTEEEMQIIEKQFLEIGQTIRTFRKSVIKPEVAKYVENYFKNENCDLGKTVENKKTPEWIIKYFNLNEFYTTEEAEKRRELIEKVERIRRNIPEPKPRKENPEFEEPLDLSTASEISDSESKSANAP